MRTVLIVDDLPENLAFLEALLRGNGFEVRSAKNGAEALESARGSPPDLVVSDVLMPLMDGYALCREWKSDDRLRDIPFIFYTATYTGPKDEALGLRLGAARFVIKPQEPDALMGIIREVLAGSREQLLTGLPPHVDDLSREHAEAVARKLEAKVADLERVNRELERQIAERAQAEEKLRQSEEAYRTLFNWAGDAIFICEPSGRFLDANDVACERLGYARVELLAMTPRDLEDPSAANELARRTEIIAREGSALFETVHLARDGRRIPIEINSRLIHFRGSEAILSITRDISERKRADAERQRLEEQLRAIQKMEAVGILAGGIAHDFNNLLSVILSYTGIVLEAVGEKDPLRADLLEVKRSGERAAALTRQLLAFSRKQVLQPVPLSLNHVAEGVEKMLRRIIGEDIDFLQVLAPDLGVTRADPGQMEQVLMNLVVNARDAMPGGGKLTIETSNAELDEAYAAQHLGVSPGPYVLLAVTDSGCGMDAEIVARIFDPFFTTKEKGKGTGLGLPMVYGIVKQSGGHVGVYSEPGRGTSFKVYLPRDLSAKAAAATRATSVPTRMVGTETLLVVEDEEALIRVARRSLGQAGYTVLTAGDGEEALRVAAAHPGTIHLLATDVIMPRMDGKALATELSRSRPGLKVLFMSGYTDDAILHHGVLDPGMSFLSKPFTSVELGRKVREVLDRDVTPRPAQLSDPDAEAPDPVELPVGRHSLGALPPGLVASLCQAVVAARHDDMIDLIATIERTDPALAGGLRMMANRFDYAGLRDLLNE